MKNLKMVSVLSVCLLALSPLFIAALCTQERGSGNAGGSGSAGYEMVRVPGGSFQMGDTIGGGDEDEQPVHTVTLSAFSIGKYEVTQALYESVMGYNPSHFGGDNSLPVESVSWYEAIEFCNKLSEKENLEPVYTIIERVPETGYPIENANVTADWSKNGYRLPTEAQWEYAAKGGDGSPGNYAYAGSNNPDEVAWYWENSGKKTQNVGTKKPNGLGLYDMSGNVWEWCWDWYYYYYEDSPQTDPMGAPLGFSRMFRGGSWGSSAGGIRSAGRNDGKSSYRDSENGFRLVRP